MSFPIVNVKTIFQAEDGIRDLTVTGVQTCALPILFDMNKEVYNALCPMCKKETSEAENLSFYACKYSVDGKYKDKEEQIQQVVEKNLLAPLDKLLTFEKEGHRRDWLYLQITVERR